MARQSKGQKKTVERVMHEFKHGELKSGAGKKVKSRKQAIAIGLSEAGASKKQSPKENKRRLEETKSRERKGKTAPARSEGKRTSKPAPKTSARATSSSARRKRK